MPVVKMRAYQLLWFSGESRGEVRLYINADAVADMTIEVQSAGELLAWDTLLSDRDMKHVSAPAPGGPVVLTDIKQIP